MILSLHGLAGFVGGTLGGTGLGLGRGLGLGLGVGLGWGLGCGLCFRVSGNLCGCVGFGVVGLATAGKRRA